MLSQWTGPVLRAALALTAAALALVTAVEYRDLRASREAEAARMERDGLTPDPAAVARARAIAVSASAARRRGPVHREGMGRW